MAGSLLAKGKRWISRDTLSLLSSYTKSAGEPLLPWFEPGPDPGAEGSLNMGTVLGRAVMV